MNGESLPFDQTCSLPASPASSEDPRVVAALEEYLSAVTRGEPPLKEEFLDRYPEVMSELAACLEGLQFVQGVADDLRSSPSADRTSDRLPFERIGDFRILREIGRGGMGVVRDYRILGGDILVSLSSERQHVAAQGGCGGVSGAVGEFVVNPGQADEQRLPSAAADVPLPRGSVLSIRTPGGGGFGPVERRDPQQVERDVREARISETHAKGVYRWHTPA